MKTRLFSTKLLLSPAFFKCIGATWLVLQCITLHAQNSMVGDGFGGRLWYKPYNYTVGSYSAYTVCGDSDQLYSWGGNNHYELGDGSKISTTNPVKAAGMTHIKYYSTGYNMGAIKHDSTAWFWGAPVSNFPIKLFGNARFLDAGALMCSFVKYDGTVWSVGLNNSGIFGNDSTSNMATSMPRMAKDITTAVRVAISRSVMAILLSDGTVMVCGSNTSGGLGNRLPSNFVAKTPIKVTRLRKIVDIKGNATNLAALDSFGNVYTWGGATALGNGSTINSDTPVLVSSISDIVAISGCDDGFHFMALDKDHNAYAWGGNYGGSLGTGNTNPVYTATLVATDVADIMAGETFSYLVKIDGSLWAAGRSNGGSIWMNLKDSVRHAFTEIDPTIAPLNLCSLPQFAANYFTIKTIPCVYDSITIEAAKNDSFRNFHWDFGDGSPQVYGVKVKHKFSKVGTYPISLLSIKKSSGLNDTVIRKLTIKDASYAPLFDADTLICGRVAYTKYPKYYDDDAVYRWQDGIPTFTNFITHGGLYTLQVTDENGCHYKDSFVVHAHEPPKALYKADTYSMCVNSNLNIKFTNLSSSPDSIVRCLWNFTEDTLSSTDKEVYYKYKKADYYPVFLSVWTKYGCKGDTIDVFDILPAPKPKFDFILSDSCINKNSISFINKTAKDTIQNPRFKWYFSEGFILSNKNPIAPRVYSDTGKFYIDLIYINTNTCTDTLRKYLHIYPKPKTNFSLTSPVCSRDSIPFINASSSVYQPLQFKWNFGDNTGSNLTQLKHKYAQKGNYSVSLSSISPQGCKDTMFQNLVVYKPPSASFTINDSVQCLIDNLFKFSSSSKADSGNLVSEQWTYGDLTYANGKNPADKSFSNAQLFSVQLLVKDIFSCSNSLIKWIEVKNGPIADFSINSRSQCENIQNFTFTYLPKFGNDSIQDIEWKLLGNSYPSQSQLIHSNLPLGKTTVDLILKTKFGCPGLHSENVFVNPKPKAAFTINNAEQCFDNHGFVFNSNSSISSGNIKAYRWDFGDMSNSILSTPLPKTYAALGNYTVKLSLISDSTCSDSISIPVVLHPNPLVSVSSVLPVCLNEKSIFTNASSISSGTIVSYSWDFGDQNSSMLSDPQHAYANAGNYTVSLTALSDKGCSSSKSFPALALVYPLPSADFIYKVVEGDKNNSLVQFSNNTQPYPLYSNWNFGRFGRSLSDTSISVQDTATIYTTLFVTNQNGCSSKISKSIFASGPLLVFFPSAFTPNNDYLNDFYGPNGVITTRDFDFRIYNRWGEEVFQSSQLNKGWDGKYQDEACEEGVYTYILHLHDINGIPKIYRGTFTLLR